jgi:hypothetical protein
MADNYGLKGMNFQEKILRSRTLRGIFRIHMGCSIVRSWSRDIEIPSGSSVHLFDYLLYRKTNQGEPFDEWIKTRTLLDP